MHYGMKHTIFPLLLILSAFACKKPVLEPHAAASYTAVMEAAPPLLSTTTLADTLPPQALTALQTGTVNGVKLTYAGGRYASYFAYQANPQTVIETISTLPFARYAVVADTVCYKTSFTTLAQLQQTLSDTELQSSAFFWNAPHDQFEVYECLKAPLRHTLLISRRSGQVFHRVEYVG